MLPFPRKSLTYVEKRLELGVGKMLMAEERQSEREGEEEAERKEGRREGRQTSKNQCCTDG